MSENSIHWLVDKHVMINKIYAWDVESFASHIIAVNEMVNTSHLPLVHTLWDLQDLEQYPKNLNEIRKVVSPLFTNERLGWVISVMQNPIIGFLSQAGTSMYRLRYRTFKRMDEAITFLREVDATIPPIDT
jgi:hypothetical protein